MDLETASVKVLRYVIAHDSGRPINELTMEGQVHGGLAHGLGYALYEEAVYDDEAGLKSASFLDYSIPSAPELAFELEALHIVTPSAQNPEGIRGAGEAAAIPASAAIASAVEDALRKRGVDAEVAERTDARFLQRRAKDLVDVVAGVQAAVPHQVDGA